MYGSLGLFRFTNVFMSDEISYYEFLKLCQEICEIVSCNNKMKFVIENAEIMKVLILLDNVGIVRLNA